MLINKGKMVFFITELRFRFVFMGLMKKVGEFGVEILWVGVFGLLRRFLVLIFYL